MLCEGVMLSFVLAVVVVTNRVGVRLAAALRACELRVLVQRSFPSTTVS